jgi:peptidoglycan/xylan/chitin deacetylase (PgdA/CDA1 family)
MIYRVIAKVTFAVFALGALTAGLAGLFFHHEPRAAVWMSAALAADAVLLVAMLERRAPFFGRIFWHGRRDAQEIALSFDDGPNEPYTSQVLDVLKRYDVRATFFVIGSNAERHPDAVRRLAAEGHEIGNHTFDHGVLPLRGPGHIRETVRAASDTVQRIAGIRPRLFRAPHGWRNMWVDRIARQEGMESVAWTLGVFDTARPGADVVRERTGRGLGNGSIVLLHDGRGTETGTDSSQLVEALPGIIQDARQRGYRFTTIGRMVDASRHR